MKSASVRITAHLVIVAQVREVGRHQIVAALRDHARHGPPRGRLGQERGRAKLSPRGKRIRQILVDHQRLVHLEFSRAERTFFVKTIAKYTW